MLLTISRMYVITTTISVCFQPTNNVDAIDTKMLCCVMWGKGKKMSISFFFLTLVSRQHYVLLADICVENSYHNHSLVYITKTFSHI